MESPRACPSDNSVAAHAQISNMAVAIDLDPDDDSAMADYAFQFSEL